MKPFHNVIEPLFNSEEYTEYMDSIPILKRISIGIFSWAGDGNPNDAHFWGKQDFLTDPQFQGESEINYFRKTNTDLVTFLQTEGWLCLVRIRKVLRMLNNIENYEETIESLSRAAGYPVDSWGNVFEKMHPQQCKCAPCSALREVRKQLVKKNISGQDVTQSVIHHIRRCVYRVLISGMDRIFETFCSRRFSVVWFILSEEFDEHYRDTEFERLCSLIMNDIVAIEPLTSLGNFGKTLTELYEGATDLARAVLHKFAVILGSQKMFYTTSMNFIMFYIDSFNMLIRMLRWLESKFKVFNQMANRISDQSYDDRLDFKSLILHAMNELVYSVPDVVNRREAALKVIAAYQKLQKSYFGPNIENLERYLDYIDTTLFAATSVFQMAKLPCKCPTFKVPKKNVIDAALYINPYRDDQFDAPQVFHCYWQDRFIIERSQTPWKILYNNKAKVLLRLSVENPADKNKKLAINVFLAEENCSVEDRIKDQYFALYESRLERLVDFFDVLKQEVIEYYANTNQPLDSTPKVKTRNSCKSKNNPLSTGAMCRRLNSNANLTKISVPVKLKRPDRRSRYARDNRMAILSSLMQKHRKSKKPSTIENLEQLLTFAVKTGVEGSGMLPELAGDTKDVYVSITSIDKARRAKADQEFSLHELMSFIIFWYARHGCVTEFEGHTLHKTTFGCSKSSFKDSFPLLYKAAEELDAAVGEGLLSDSDLALLEKGLQNSMTEEEIKRCKKGLETTLLMKREFNELVQSKRAFAKLSSSGFCVTLSAPADGSAVLCGEVEAKRGDSATRKAKITTKVPDIRHRMRKTLEGRTTTHEVVTTTTKSSCTVNIQPVKAQVVEESMKPPPQAKPKEEPNIAKDLPPSKDLDVDELVQIIEGTHIKSSESNPKKAAKKLRQKEKKEQERQRIADEKAKEEEQRRREELRRIEEEKRKEEQERKRREEEEQRRKDEIIRKQRELAELKKEEQRKKRQELERKKAEEKKLKKEAKKQRREQRKKEMETLEEEDGSEKRTSTPNESFTKTEHVNGKEGNRTPSIDLVSEKEYGRLKHEKEQRKREEEEARRIQELQAQERSQANKKNKKKKKKTKSSESQSESSNDANQSKDHDDKPVGQPLIDLLNSSKCNDTPARGSDEKSNLVTIKKHMDSSVTISMKGKEGESDLVYTLMNGQVYPTSVDGKIRTEAPLPLQPTTFVKQETTFRPNHVVTMASTANHSNMGHHLNTVKSSMYQAPVGCSSNYMTKENSSVPDIDLSQLKLPPGITITKVPQHMSGPRGDEMNGVQNVDYHLRSVGQPNITDYHRPMSVGGADHRHNSNIVMVDSRCSSLESPVIGVRPSEMAFGANGTRPSSEASVASDRPSSGLDSLCNNNGSSPYVGRTGYPSTEILNKRVPISLSSPYTAVSRNETPSPAWQNEVHPNMCGMPGMIPQNNVAQDRHGFWSSTPASPVAFPPTNSVNESYLRAQDQHFIRPRPQQRGGYPQIGKRTSPPSGMGTDSTLFTRKAPLTDFKPIGGVGTNVAPQCNQGPISMNGSTTPSKLGPIGYKPVNESGHIKPPNEWTPWNHNAESRSPDVNPTASTFVVPPEVNFSMNGILSDDINGPWQSMPIEKPASRTVNPFGPIGSNITRRASNATSNGLHGKLTETSGVEDASLWAYNRTY